MEVSITKLNEIDRSEKFFPLMLMLEEQGENVI